MQSSKQMFQLNFFLYISVLYLEQKSFKIRENVYWVIEHAIPLASSQKYGTLSMFFHQTAAAFEKASQDLIKWPANNGTEQSNIIKKNFLSCVKGICMLIGMSGRTAEVFFFFTRKLVQYQHGCLGQQITCFDVYQDRHNYK